MSSGSRVALFCPNGREEACSGDDRRECARLDRLGGLDSTGTEFAFQTNRPATRSPAFRKPEDLDWRKRQAVSWGSLRPSCELKPLCSESIRQVFRVQRLGRNSIVTNPPHRLIPVAKRVLHRKIPQQCQPEFHRVRLRGLVWKSRPLSGLPCSAASQRLLVHPSDIPLPMPETAIENVAMPSQTAGQRGVLEQVMHLPGQLLPLSRPPGMDAGLPSRSA